MTTEKERFVLYAKEWHVVKQEKIDLLCHNHEIDGISGKFCCLWQGTSKRVLEH